MKYNYREGVEKPKSRKRFILPVLILAGGAYALATYLAPDLLYVVEPPDATAKKLVVQKPAQTEARLYIPKLNADISVLGVDEGGSVDRAAQERSTASGNPAEGGNYVLAANRFSLGLTPMDTKAKSPFYHLAKLSSGDDIYVDYKGVRYAYKVEEVKPVESITSFEERSDEPRLTLYTSEAAGRHVVTAKQTGKIVWTSGQPKLQPLPGS